jgi:hypothetical protein
MITSGANAGANPTGNTAPRAGGNTGPKVCPNKVCPNKVRPNRGCPNKVCPNRGHPNKDGAIPNSRAMAQSRAGASPNGDASAPAARH